jgi:hypothetical protein
LLQAGRGLHRALTLLVTPIATAPADAATHAKAKIVAGGWSIADPKATPGDVLTTSAKKVCVKGYSATVRNVSTSFSAGCPRSGGQSVVAGSAVIGVGGGR